MSVVADILQAVAVFLAGLFARLGIFLAMLAVLLLPALVIALGRRWVGARRGRALGLRRVAGLVFRPGAWYAPGHTWLERRGGGALQIGLDDLALRLMPSVTAVELPRPGATLARGDVIARLHGGGRALAIPSPIAGTVAGVNAAVLRDPSLVKQDGYGRGWLVALAPADRAFEAFPRGGEAEAFLRREAGRFGRFLEDRLGFAAADGGELVSPAPWLVGEEGWKALAGAFLSP
ncbi:MAG TPA: glycine cleavage system protein H [Anaeromyxobacter sp.]